MLQNRAYLFINLFLIICFHKWKASGWLLGTSSIIRTYSCLGVIMLLNKKQRKIVFDDFISTV